MESLKVMLNDWPVLCEVSSGTRRLAFTSSCMPLCHFSIDTMSEVMRHAIETGQRLKDQIILQQEDFLVDSV